MALWVGQSRIAEEDVRLIVVRHTETVSSHVGKVCVMLVTSRRLAGVVSRLMCPLFGGLVCHCLTASSECEGLVGLSVGGELGVHWIPYSGASNDGWRVAREVSFDLSCDAQFLNCALLRCWDAGAARWKRLRKGLVPGVLT